MTPRWRRRAAAIALAGLAGDAFAEIPQDRAWAELEYFFSQIRSSARLDSTTARNAALIASHVDWKTTLRILGRQGI
jgi:hypothetical protein